MRGRSLQGARRTSGTQKSRHETFARKARFRRQKPLRRRNNSGFHAVADYRLYCLDGVSKVSSAEWFDAADDEAAIEVAKMTHEGYECELWRGKRLVARLDLRQQA
jgi:hypothetical protein